MKTPVPFLKWLLVVTRLDQPFYNALNFGLEVILTFPTTAVLYLFLVQQQVAPIKSGVPSGPTVSKAVFDIFQFPPRGKNPTIPSIHHDVVVLKKCTHQNHPHIVEGCLKDWLFDTGSWYFWCKGRYMWRLLPVGLLLFTFLVVERSCSVVF